MLTCHKLTMSQSTTHLCRPPILPPLLQCAQMGKAKATERAAAKEAAKAKEKQQRGKQRRPFTLNQSPHESDTGGSDPDEQPLPPLALRSVARVSTPTKWVMRVARRHAPRRQTVLMQTRMTLSCGALPLP